MCIRICKLSYVYIVYFHGTAIFTFIILTSPDNGYLMSIIVTPDISATNFSSYLVHHFIFLQLTTMCESPFLSSSALFF